MPFVIIKTVFSSTDYIGAWKSEPEACKMTQQVNSHAAKSNDLHEIPRIHMVEEENQLPQDFLTSTRVLCMFWCVCVCVYA